VLVRAGRLRRMHRIVRRLQRWWLLLARLGSKEVFSQA